MATVKDITTMCKVGNVLEAYKTAKADLEAYPQDVWSHREVGWALYYMLKFDIQNHFCEDFINHVEELTNLSLLTIADDSVIFDNMLWKIAEFIKYMPKDNVEGIDRMYSLISKYTFKPSKGYSYLLKSYLGFETWERLVDFFEWWNIEKLLPEDYQPFKRENGQKIMSLAEQVYIAYSKALLRLNDKDKIRDFLPQIEKLMEAHPEMIYPGYFCGKLMLAMGAAKEDALNIVMPFVRKKRSEFWIWQLLSEIYRDDTNTRQACLLRAVHCKTQETFLGRVRILLVSMYLSRNDFQRAKYHLDKVTRCYLQQGWHLPIELRNWINDKWVQNAVADSSIDIDYMQITDAILSYGANENLAVVTYVDTTNKRTAIVYDKEKRIIVKPSDLHIRVKVGTLLRIYWTSAPKNGINIIRAESVDSVVSCTYIKFIKGNIHKPKNKPFAFIKENDVNCFITPHTVQKYNVNGEEKATALAVYDYNKKKKQWAWTCVSINK